jgi:predicted nucleic acid-binding protein
MLDLAFAARADFIVTWDPHLLHRPNPLPTRVVEPRQLVALARLP